MDFSDQTVGNKMALGIAGALIFLGAPFVGRDIEFNMGHLMDRIITKALVVFAVVWLGTKDVNSAVAVTLLLGLVIGIFRWLSPRPTPKPPCPSCGRE